MSDYASAGVLLRAALAELDQAVPGSPSGPSVRELVETLAPVVHARVAAVFVRHASKRPGGDLRQDIEDQVQSTFVLLFDRQGHVLRAWDETKGLSLANWVGRLARLRAMDAVRTGMRGPWHHDATEHSFFEARTAAGATPENLRWTKELWRETQRRILARESSDGQQMFELLFVRDLSTQEISTITSKSDAAIFKWRSRLRKSIKQELDGLLSEGRRVGE